jgi:uncharacterized short protein YbdD (DUF466 family)
MKKLWALIRQLSGEDAYERYLDHVTKYHSGQTPLDRKTFFAREEERKWSGIRRCC